MNTSNFDSKDATRIADILSKAQDGRRTKESYAEQMAAAITSAEKAERRAAAAWAVGESGLAHIFATRAKELRAPKPPQHRYVNVAVIKQDGATSSQQIWTKDLSDASQILEQMMADAYRMKNPVVLALIADPFTSILRYTVLDLVATILN